MTTTDLHAVFAYLDGGATIRLTPWLDWHTAQERWTLADDVRRDLSGQSDVTTNVRYFVVRAQGDPDWTDSPLRPAGIVATSGRGAADDRAVLRRVGAERGLEGREGGWIYRTATGETAAQGWRSYRDRWTQAGYIVEVDRRWFVNAYRGVIRALPGGTVDGSPAALAGAVR